MKLEVVTHCWRYSRLLTYQLSSLLQNSVKSVDVTVTVFCAPREQDPETWDVLDFFSSQPVVNHVHFRWKTLDRPRLFRRAIGRNMAALESDADWVWFADCDMVFGDGCLISLKQSVTDIDADLVYPRHVYISETHEVGDQAIERIESPQLAEICLSDFVRNRYSRAIGGVQIVRGDLARRIGYCKDTRFQTPTDGKQWLNPTGDVAFRHIVGMRGIPVKISNIFRLRHSKRGQDAPEISL